MSRFPFSPFPDGWFFVCYSHELPPKKVFTKKFMGQEIVAFRGGDGRVAVADAFCPHLGAHLGKGGCVEDGALKCPFHGFRFAADGACVSTPYGPPPKAARLKRWEVHEANGFIFAYHDAEGRPPSWRLPVQDDSDYGPLRTKLFRLRGHPQETTENGVDPGHLITVHKYRELSELKPTTVDGAYLSGAYRMNRSAGPLSALLKLDAEFHVHVWGLGYSLVESGVPNIGMWARQYIFSTPSDGEYVDLHIALRLKRIAHPERILPGLDKVPSALISRVAEKMFMRVFETDIRQDFEIWEHKRFVQRPALSKNDGPIGIYRRYCRQFYPELRLPQVSAE